MPKTYLPSLFDCKCINKSKAPNFFLQKITKYIVFFQKRLSKSSVFTHLLKKCAKKSLEIKECFHYTNHRWKNISEGSDWFSHRWFGIYDVSVSSGRYGRTDYEVGRLFHKVLKVVERYSTRRVGAFEEGVSKVALRFVKAHNLFFDGVG